MSLEGYVEKRVLFRVHAPGRRIAELVVVVENVPGALAKVSGLMAEMGINILTNLGMAKAFEKEAVWSSFIDLTDTGLEVEDVVERLRKLDVVLDVKCSEEVGELLVDTLHFPVMLDRDRHVLLRVETFGKAFGRLFDIFGSGAVTIIYQMGRESGMSKAEKVMREYGLKGVDALRVILKERVAKGWCIPEIEVFNEKKNEAVIKVYELFECLPFKGKLKEPRSHLARGYIAGVFKAIFGVDCMVTETECLAKGDPYCRFIVTQHPGKQEGIYSP